MSVPPLQFFRRTTPLLLLLMALPLCLSTGCSRFRRTKQCRALIALTNPALDEGLVLAHAQPGKPPGSGYLAAAARYERLAKDLGPLEFASEDMAKYVAEYAGVLNNAARHLHALAAALDANDAPEADREKRELERVLSHERSVVARMDAWCQP